MTCEIADKIDQLMSCVQGDKILCMNNSTKDKLFAEVSELGFINHDANGYSYTGVPIVIDSEMTRDEVYCLPVEVY